MFIQNATVIEFSDRAQCAISGAKYSFKTKFSVIGAESQEPSHKFMKQIPSDPKKTKQLHSMPNVAVEEKTEISPHKIRR